MKGMASWMGGTVTAPTDKEQDTLRHKGATQPGIMYGSHPPLSPTFKPAFQRAWMGYPVAYCAAASWVYHILRYHRRGLGSGAESWFDRCSAGTPRHAHPVRQGAPPARDWGECTAATLTSPIPREPRGFRWPYPGPGLLVTLKSAQRALCVC